MDKLHDAIQWLGLDSASLISTKEQVWLELVRVVKKTKRPAQVTDLASTIGRHRNRVHVYLASLRAEGRAERMDTGWIPLRPAKADKR